MNKNWKLIRQWLSITIKSIGDAVIVTNTESIVLFLNLVAESLTGWKQEEAIGKTVEVIYNIIDERHTRQ